MKIKLLTKDYWKDKAWYALNLMSFKKYSVKLGTDLHVRGKILISFEKLIDDSNKNPEIIIGSNVSINSGEMNNLIGCGSKTIFRIFDNGVIRIGDNVGISNAAIIALKEIIVEDNVLIGGGVRIYDTDFHPIEYSNRVQNNTESVRSKEIIIKEGAFIGAGSIILKGVTIGKHSIVGAGSVVRTSIPDNEIWAGNPACFIKTIS